MKKLIILALLVFIVAGCEPYCSNGPKLPVQVTKGSLRTTETGEYIVTERCIDLYGINRNTPVWKIESVNKK